MRAALAITALAAGAIAPGQAAAHSVDILDHMPKMLASAEGRVAQPPAIGGSWQFDDGSVATVTPAPRRLGRRETLRVRRGRSIDLYLADPVSGVSAFLLRGARPVAVSPLAGDPRRWRLRVPRLRRGSSAEIGIDAEHARGRPHYRLRLRIL